MGAVLCARRIFLNERCKKVRISRETDFEFEREDLRKNLMAIS